MLTTIFVKVAETIIHNDTELSTTLIAAQCLTQICDKIKALENVVIDSNLLRKIYIKLLQLLKSFEDDILVIPIECIVALYKLNIEEAIQVPLKHSKLIVDIYSEHYNHPVIGIKILELIKLWCKDRRSAKILLNLFVPFAIKVFDEFFKTLGKNSDKKDFEEVKRTVMTTHANNDMEFKTSLDMLPVNYY